MSLDPEGFDFFQQSDEMRSVPVSVIRPWIVDHQEVWTIEKATGGTPVSA